MLIGCHYDDMKSYHHCTRNIYDNIVLKEKETANNYSNIINNYNNNNLTGSVLNYFIQGARDTDSVGFGNIVRETLTHKLLQNQRTLNKMRPPKLPGAEKFRFYDRSISEDGTSSLRTSASDSEVSYILPRNMFVRGHVIRNTCPVGHQGKTGSAVICDIIDGQRLITDDIDVVDSENIVGVVSVVDDTVGDHRSDISGPRSLSSLRLQDSNRRKAILPITSRLTAKVLTSTDLPLDLFDIRDYHRLTRLREVSSKKSEKLSKVSNNNNINNNNNTNRIATSTSTSSLPSTDGTEMDSNLSNTSNLSNLSLASTSTSSCPPISESIIV